jgi:MFS family permease
MSQIISSLDGVQPTAQSADQVGAVYSKVTWRILPLLLICYIIAYLDRINIGYAQLQMKQTLSFTDAAYGLGAGIFFLGYFLFEVPSNLMLEKIGARKTLLRIMFCWGIVASAMMFVTTPAEFYIARFLLGAFEAGFFPGVVLYLTYWYPSIRRGQIIAIFMTATTVASVIAGPLCGGIMKYMDGLNGWYGWQWLYLVQGLPATALGILAYISLRDRPDDAPWLNAAEKNILRDQLERDRGLVVGGTHGNLRQMLVRKCTYSRSSIFWCSVRPILSCSGRLP